MTEQQAFLTDNPLTCECGSREFVFVEWKHTVVVAACAKCKRTYDYDKLDVHGTWKLSTGAADVYQEITDQPVTCPKCGSRTEYTEAGGFQHHTCPGCGNRFRAR